MASELEQYSIDDVVATCSACGAYSLTRDPWEIKHYLGCGGIKEIEKWDRYYNGLEEEDDDEGFP